MARRLTTNQEIAGSIPASVNSIAVILTRMTSLLFSSTEEHRDRFLVEMSFFVNHNASWMDVGGATSYTALGQVGDVDGSIGRSRLQVLGWFGQKNESHPYF
jgi:hypothetical protein